MGDSGKGAVFRDRQEALTYGNRIKGDRPVSVQLFESGSTILEQCRALTTIWVTSKAVVEGDGEWNSIAEGVRMHCPMNRTEKFGFDLSSGPHIKIDSLRLVTWILLKEEFLGRFWIFTITDEFRAEPRCIPIKHQSVGHGGMKKSA